MGCEAPGNRSLSSSKGLASSRVASLIFLKFLSMFEGNASGPPLPPARTSAVLSFREENLNMGASRTPIKDDDQIVQGYLEEMPDGRSIALDLNCQCKAIYDPLLDATISPNGKLIMRGNILADLILGYFGCW
jgi:hypothetical protein